MQRVKVWQPTESESSTSDRTTAHAFDELRRLIVSGQLHAGDKLNQRELAQRLGLSRTPLTKALHKLETAGFVENKPDRGFFVRKVTIRELLGLYALREALDLMIAEEVVRSIPLEMVTELKAAFLSVNPMEEGFDETRYWEIDKAFHESLMAVSSNVLAQRVNEHFQVYNRTFVAGLPRPPSITFVEHMEILGAIEQRDVERAKDLMVKHIRMTKDYLDEAVRRLEAIGVDPEQLSMQEMPVDQKLRR